MGPATENAELIRLPEGGAYSDQEFVQEMEGHKALHVKAAYLRPYALGQLPAELAIIIDFHLRMCVPCGIQFRETRASIGHPFPGSQKFKRFGEERRKSIRVPTDDPAVLTILQPEASGHINARVLDASMEGLRLSIPRELMRGTVVQVHLRDLFILAEVRYCRMADGGFHAGVLIRDVFPASGGPK
jgi:PilZ domain-containing protein